MHVSPKVHEEGMPKRVAVGGQELPTYGEEVGDQDKKKKKKTSKGNRNLSHSIKFQIIYSLLIISLSFSVQPHAFVDFMLQKIEKLEKNSNKGKSIVRLEKSS